MLINTQPMCSKCGNRDVSPTWHKEGSGCYGDMRVHEILAYKEQLHFLCKCGYEWITNCVDHVVKPAPPEVTDVPEGTEILHRVEGP